MLLTFVVSCCSECLLHIQDDLPLLQASMEASSSSCNTADYDLGGSEA